MPKPQTITSRTQTTDSAGNADRGQIEVLAYQLWIDRGSPVGSPEEDWYRAESELNERYSPTRAA
jgi:hypothetical protein